MVRKFGRFSARFSARLSAPLAVMISTALFAAASIPAGAAEPIQLEFGNWLPSTHPQSVNSFEPWKKLVEEKTKGRIKVNLYHGGTLGTSRAVLNDVKGGVYHLGLMVSAYYFDTPIFKVTIGELPFALPGPIVGSKILAEWTQKHANDIWDKIGVKSLGVFCTDAYNLFSTKPIRRFEDMKGVKLRAAGKAWVQVAKDWGAVPTPMQPEEAYTALERGTLTAMHYSPAGALGWKYFEPAPYLIRIDSPVVVGGLLLNKAFYDKLPPDLKKMFDEELGPALSNMMIQIYDKVGRDAIDHIANAVKGKGEIITLSAEERAKFIKVTQPEWDNWVKEANKRGFQGDVMMADFKAIMRKHGVTPPF